MLFLREVASMQTQGWNIPLVLVTRKAFWCFVLFCFYGYDILNIHLSLFYLAIGKLRAKFIEYIGKYILSYHSGPRFLLYIFTFL